MKLRKATLLAMFGISIYTIYYLLPVLGVAIEVEELIKINPAVLVYIRDFGYIRVLLLPCCVYIPLIVFLNSLYKR